MKTAELKFYGFIIFPALSGAGTHHRVTLRCVTRGSRDALILFSTWPPHIAFQAKQICSERFVP